MDLFQEAAEVIKNSNNIVFFGGAGVSTECGIPDFRSSSGIYNRNYNSNPEEILSLSFFKHNPDIFYDFLWNNLVFFKVKPNKGHRALSELEHMGKIKAIVTQNIDGLHQMAGSNNVIELHGSLKNFYCTSCFKGYSLNDIKEYSKVPLCSCGKLIRPDIVLYEESLKEDTLEKAIHYISNAEVLIVAGTSLLVYPAAGLLRYFKGQKLIIINKDKTNYDSYADIIFRTPFSATMEKIMITLGLWTID